MLAKRVNAYHYCVHVCNRKAQYSLCFCFQEQIQEAIDCALEAKKSWEKTPFEHRFVVILAGGEEGRWRWGKGEERERGGKR